MAWPTDGLGDPYEFLLGFTMGFVLRLRGVLCLHAAAVVGPRGGALAVAGVPGVGKSTVVAALASRGYAVLTDDVAAVTPRQDGTFELHPGPARLRPRRAGLAGLSTVSSAASWTASPLTECVEIDLSQPGFAHAREARTLEMVCFLEGQRNRVALELAPISQADAFIRLLGDTWAGRLQSRDMRRQEFGEMASLTSAILPFRATYPLDSEWIRVLIPDLERVLDTL
ncbi:MAG: hypothetical protein AB7Q29_02300 [Vicinamibacterales bacterium]